MRNVFQFLPRRKKTIPFSTFAEYFIGSEVRAEGSCKTDQDIYIDGDFKGEIETTGLIELAKNSHVSADINARSAVLEGDYKGNLVCSEELRIANCANAAGKLSSPNLNIDKGAIVNAKITMERT